MSGQVLPWVARSKIHLGANAWIDEGVTLGYLPERTIADLTLTIGAGARIRSGSTIYAGTRIGDGLNTGHGVVIREENKIGSHLNLWSHSVIDYGCVVGNRVKVHSQVYVAQFTIIEDEVFLAPGVVIANDLYPGSRNARDHLQGPLIKRGAQVGINATILPGVAIGEYAVVGAGSVVTKDVLERTVVYGNPAHVVGRIDELRSELPGIGYPYRSEQ